MYIKDFSDKVDVRRVLNALINVGLVPISLLRGR